jgi:hypothetical protein
MMQLLSSQNETSSEDNLTFNGHADQVVVESHVQKCESRHGRVEELGLSCRAASGETRRLFVISICGH